MRVRSLSSALMVSTLAAMLVFAACSGSEKEKEPVVSVQVATVRQGEIQHVIQTDAVLFPVQQAAITPKISAPVKKFYVNRGSKVKQGQLLAVLENRDLTAAEIDSKGAYEQAQATYETTTAATLPEDIQKAEADVVTAKQAFDAEEKLYESRQNLYKQGALPRKDLDASHVSFTQAQTQYEIAQKHLAALQSIGRQQTLKSAKGQLTSAQGKYLGAEAQLAYSEIRSPITGEVTDRPLYPGEMAPAGTPLITVMDTSKVIAKAHIPQDEAAFLKTGDPATMSAAGLQKPVAAKVVLVSPATDPNSTTIEIWVEAANPKGTLRAGTNVHLSMIAQSISNALIVPSESVLTNEGKNTVIIVEPDNKAHQQDVTVGIRNGNEVQITSGLKAGEIVVTNGAYGLPDNTRVQIEKPAPAPGPSESKAKEDET
ncbi:MAG TPA: efflux RND transporter periplasmic adaptor subunit [Terriglobales bacterium]|nr:efflux RND transporter periplasmic adaptor subunit [Terriglobales bacterium]